MEEVSIERVEKISEAMNKLDKADKILGRKESTFLSGIARNVNWVDVAVVSSTNQKIAFRGTRNLKTEIENILSLAFFSGGSTNEAIRNARMDKYSNELGTAPAREYGFTVNERTSVEWSLLADSYSRGGPLIYLLYLFIFFLILNLLEISIKILNRNQAEQKFLICAFIDIIIKSNTLPLYESIRGILLNIVFYVGIILILRFFTRK
jgi:hypothetical protein